MKMEATRHQLYPWYLKTHLSYDEHGRALHAILSTLDPQRTFLLLHPIWMCLLNFWTCSCVRQNHRPHSDIGCALHVVVLTLDSVHVTKPAVRFAPSVPILQVRVHKYAVLTISNPACYHLFGCTFKHPIWRYLFGCPVKLLNTIPWNKIAVYTMKPAVRSVPFAPIPDSVKVHKLTVITVTYSDSCHLFGCALYLSFSFTAECFWPRK